MLQNAPLLHSVDRSPSADSPFPLTLNKSVEIFLPPGNLLTLPTAVPGPNTL